LWYNVNMEEKGSWSIRGSTRQAQHLAKLLAVQYDVTMARVVEAAMWELWNFYLTRPKEYPATFDELLTDFRRRWLLHESRPASAPGRRSGSTNQRASRSGGG